MTVVGGISLTALHTVKTVQHLLVRPAQLGPTCRVNGDEDYIISMRQTIIHHLPPKLPGDPHTGLINVDRSREEPAQWSRSGKCFVANVCVCVRVRARVWMRRSAVCGPVLVAVRPPPVASFIPIFEQSLHHHHLTLFTRHPVLPPAFQLHLVRILLHPRDVSFVRLQLHCFIQASPTHSSLSKVRSQNSPSTPTSQSASQPVARPRKSTYPSTHLHPSSLRAKPAYVLIAIPITRPPCHSCVCCICRLPILASRHLHSRSSSTHVAVCSSCPGPRQSTLSPYPHLHPHSST